MKNSGVLSAAETSLYRVRQSLALVQDLRLAPICRFKDTFTTKLFTFAREVIHNRRGQQLLYAASKPV